MTTFIPLSTTSTGIPVNTHESIVFDTILSSGVDQTYKLAKIAKKHDFTVISRLEFPSAIFVYDYETVPSGEFLNLASHAFELAR